MAERLAQVLEKLAKEGKLQTAVGKLEEAAQTTTSTPQKDNPCTFWGVMLWVTVYLT